MSAQYPPITNAQYPTVTNTQNPVVVNKQYAPGTNTVIGPLLAMQRGSLEQMIVHTSGDDKVDGAGVMTTENQGAGTFIDMGAEWGGMLCHALATARPAPVPPIPATHCHTSYPPSVPPLHLPKHYHAPPQLRDLDLGNVKAASYVELRTASPLQPPTLEGVHPRSQSPGTYPPGRISSQELRPSIPNANTTYSILY
ncbi:hypothetical protein F5876DRAFT_84527 [Lentinula aff. lateritia]|uniref:Uncharacterized protein n=1 Tax=Lentinula aff. lateritia TaxID=2804960 RepID=A0ACC1TGJ5_9AGAR|nr:hypothetical protein F5876DRAFT_84527 [Lentinula aff. lateritia]